MTQVGLDSLKQTEQLGIPVIVFVLAYLVSWGFFENFYDQQ